MSRGRPPRHERSTRASRPRERDARRDGSGRQDRGGLAANLTGNGVTLLIQLVSVPVLLAAWGVPVYGEWLILSAIPTYLALSDLGFSSVAGNSMIVLAANGDREAAVAFGRRAWSITTVMTVAVVLAAVAIALVAGGVFGEAAAIPASETRLVLVALFAQVAVANQFAMLDVWYRAGGRYPLGTAFRQFARLLEFGALIAAVLLGAGPGGAAVAFLVGSLVGFGVSWLALRRAVTWASFRPEAPRLQTFRELVRPGLAFISFPLSNAISIQGFTIVVGATLGADCGRGVLDDTHGHARGHPGHDVDQPLDLAGAVPIDRHRETSARLEPSSDAPCSCRWSRRCHCCWCWPCSDQRRSDGGRTASSIRPPSCWRSCSSSSSRTRSGGR